VPKCAQILPIEGKRRFIAGFTVLKKGTNTMSVLTVWNPFRELDEVQNRLGSFFGTRSFDRLFGNGDSLKLADWSPQVDITEVDKEYLVKADLPEVKKEDVKVTVENGILSISGERKSEKEEKKKRFHRIECSYGRFERTFVMPKDADAAKLKAEFKDGVLRVHLPKNPAAQPKKIDVNVQ
jgi:HSP20 family protein